MTKKKILIYVNDGFSIRYLLRSNIYKNLINSVSKLIIVSHNSDEKYFKEKFTHEKVILEKCNVNKYIDYVKRHKFLRILKIFRSFVLNGKYDTQTVDDFREIYIHQKGWIIKNGILNLLYGILWRTLSYVFIKSRILRKILVQCECFFYTPKIHKEIFDKYKPDLVIVSSLCGFEYNELFAREAIRNNHKVCTIMLSWDNSSGMGYPGYFPNYIITWTEVMKKELVQLSDCNPKCIYVGGVAHFDTYFNDKVISKKNLFDKLNLDNNKKTIFYATKSPRRFPWGPEIVKFIAESSASKIIEEDVQILVRIHPLHYRKSKDNDFTQIIDQYENIEKHFSNVIINKPNLTSKKINFDMEDDEMSMTAAILSHSDIMINMFSTMIIEASIFNLPSINICLKDNFRSDDLTTRQDIMVDYRQSHCRRVYETGGVINAFTYEQLVDEINIFLKDKTIDSDKRATILNNEVGLFRGNAGSNISKIVLDLAN